MYAYAAAMGVAGGVLTVVFFTVWRQAFGPAHLGQIQGAAQLLTVLASAAGPLVLAAGHRAAGSYAPVVQNLAVGRRRVRRGRVARPAPDCPPKGRRRMIATADRPATDLPRTAYDRDGFVVVRGLFDPAEMREAVRRGRPPARPTTHTCSR